MFLKCVKMRKWNEESYKSLQITKLSLNNAQAQQIDSFFLKFYHNQTYRNIELS